MFGFNGSAIRLRIATEAAAEDERRSTHRARSRALASLLNTSADAVAVSAFQQIAAGTTAVFSNVLLDGTDSSSSAVVSNDFASVPVRVKAPVFLRRRAPCVCGGGRQALCDDRATRGYGLLH